MKGTGSRDALVVGRAIEVERSGRRYARRQPVNGPSATNAAATLSKPWDTSGARHRHSLVLAPQFLQDRIPEAKEGRSVTQSGWVLLDAERCGVVAKPASRAFL